MSELPSYLSTMSGMKHCIKNSFKLNCRYVGTSMLAINRTTLLSAPEVLSIFIQEVYDTNWTRLLGHKVFLPKIIALFVLSKITKRMVLCHFLMMKNCFFLLTLSLGVLLCFCKKCIWMKYGFNCIHSTLCVLVNNYSSCKSPLPVPPPKEFFWQCPSIT